MTLAGEATPGSVRRSQGPWARPLKAQGLWVRVRRALLCTNSTCRTLGGLHPRSQKMGEHPQQSVAAWCSGVESTMSCADGCMTPT